MTSLRSRGLPLALRRSGLTPAGPAWLPLWRSHAPRVHAGLTFGQLDFSPQALRFRLLGNRHFQNAFLELCLGVVGVDPLRQGDGTLEATVVTLRVIIVALFLLDLLLTFDRKHIAGHRDLDILLIEAGQLGC